MTLQVLTTTGSRPEAFSLCARYMRRQSYRGSVRWVIVDDGEETMPAPDMPENWTVLVLRVRPAWQPGQNTQARNLRAGFAALDPAHPVVIVEDDDWYSPDWLQACAAAMQDCELFGESRARYYHVGRRVARAMGNQHHASLCSTAVRGRALRELVQIAGRMKDGIDIALWRSSKAARRLVAPQHVVGIKGMPGRAGIGVGHRAQFNGDADPALSCLRGWIGKDADLYACFSF